MAALNYSQQVKIKATNTTFVAVTTMKLASTEKQRNPSMDISEKSDCHI